MGPRLEGWDQSYCCPSERGGYSARSGRAAQFTPRYSKGGAPQDEVLIVEGVPMDALSDYDLALMMFGVGQPVPRKEDPTLLRGHGRYTDDINLSGQAYAVMVRSRI